MSVREGRWDLLDLDSDPVVADRQGVDERIAHYAKVAEAIRVESARLHRIASGEALRGAYADELRSSAGEVARDLDQVQARYDSVATALRIYGPELDAALTGTWDALQMAVAADGASAQAKAMPQQTPISGQSLTPEQTQQNADRAQALSTAADRLSAAKARLSGALTALDAAGRTAAATVRSGFGHGLTDSGWDRFKAGFIKFLKVLIKVLTYIAIALAAIALIIPGVGEAILAAGIAIAAVTVVANGALIAMGEGSWADFGIAIAGLLTFGAAKVFGPVIKSAVSAIKNAIGKAGAEAFQGVEGLGNDVALGLRGGGGDRFDEFIAGLKNSFRRRPGPTGAGRGDAGDQPPQLDWEPSSGHLERGQAPTPEDAVRTYTSTGQYQTINGMLRGTDTPLAQNLTRPGRAVDDVFRHVGNASSIDHYLKLAPGTGITNTYRGVYGPFAKELQGLRPGDVFTEDGFMSTSHNPNIGSGFNRQGLDNTFMTVTGSSGRDVRGLSGLPQQEEYLYPSGTQFRVLYSEIRDDGVHYLGLEEIPQSAEESGIVSQWVVR